MCAFRAPLVWNGWILGVVELVEKFDPLLLVTLGFVSVVEGIVEKLDPLLLATPGFVTEVEGIVEKLDPLLLATPGFVTVAEDIVGPVGIGTFEHKIWSVFDPPGHTVHTDTLGLAADGNGEVIGNESGYM